MTECVLFQIPMMLVLECKHHSRINRVPVARSDPSVDNKNK
jgi:hypothetical protein